MSLAASRKKLAASLDDAAPHLSDAERAELQGAYLGNLTWQEACGSVGVPFDELPATTAGSKSHREGSANDGGKLSS